MRKRIGLCFGYKLACAKLHGSDSFNLLNVYPVFVSKFTTLIFDNIRLFTEKRITTLSKMYLLFCSSF